MQSYEFLTKQQVEQVHSASLQILEKIGKEKTNENHPHQSHNGKYTTGNSVSLDSGTLSGDLESHLLPFSAVSAGRFDLLVPVRPWASVSGVTALMRVYVRQPTCMQPPLCRGFMSRVNLCCDGKSAMLFRTVLLSLQTMLFHCHSAYLKGS